MTGDSFASGLEVVLARIEMKLDESIRIGGDHETRIRALESNRWPLPTLTAVLAVAATSISVITLFR